jgi:transcriptional regulator with XRE-family HTH domain
MGDMPDRSVTTSELGDFLRARRERLSPADVGLPDAGRRRTPGLRREEVATLAGVSVDYLIRLEQGRDHRPSGSILTAIGNALLLDQEELAHLKKMGLFSANAEQCPAARLMPTLVAPTVLAMLDGLGPMPAFVLGPANDVLAANSSWNALVEPLGLLGSDRVNLARFTFLDEAARTAYPDWARAADEQASQLRGAFLLWGTDPSFAELVGDLRQDPEFESRWVRHPVAEKRRGLKRLQHPELGELRLAFEVLMLPGDDLRLVTWLPADEATSAALQDARPRLRVVGQD